MIYLGVQLLPLVGHHTLPETVDLVSPMCTEGFQSLGQLSLPSALLEQN